MAKIKPLVMARRRRIQCNNNNLNEKALWCMIAGDQKWNYVHTLYAKCLETIHERTEHVESCEKIKNNEKCIIDSRFYQKKVSRRILYVQ